MPRWCQVPVVLAIACLAPAGCTAADFTVHLTPPAPADRPTAFDALAHTQSPCIAFGAKLYDPLHPAVYLNAVRPTMIVPSLASAPTEPALPRCLAQLGMPLLPPLPAQSRYLLQLIVLDQADAIDTQPDATRLHTVAAIDFPLPSSGADVCVNSPRTARPNADILAAAWSRCNDLAAQGPAAGPCVLTFNDTVCGDGTP